MKHATSRLLFAYWDALRRDRAAPERGEIDPGQIRHILADTFILAVEPSGSAVFRIAGTRCSALFGRDLTGTALEALWSTDRQDEPTHLVGTVTGDTTGLVFGSLATSRDGHTLPLEVILLPLKHRGRPHTRILGALSPRSVPDWAGAAPLVAQTVTSVRIIHGRERALPVAGRRDHGFVIHQGGRYETDANRPS